MAAPLGFRQVLGGGRRRAGAGGIRLRARARGVPEAPGDPLAEGPRQHRPPHRRRRRACIKHASSGKVLAWTRLAVKTSATDTAWINLTLWDELAHVAFQHLEKGQQIYVCGRLVADTVEGDGNKRQVYYKVVVQQLNFIERSFPPVSLYGSDSSSPTNANGNSGNYAGKQGSSPEELWQAFFANPMDWWDNRKNKRNPRAPDFKHKHTGEALWIEGRYNPPWVKSQLAVLDSRMSSLQSNDTNPALSFMQDGELTHF